MFCGIHLGAISQATILYNEFEKRTLKLLPHLTGTYKLNSVYLHQSRRHFRIRHFQTHFI